MKHDHRTCTECVRRANQSADTIDRERAEADALRERIADLAAEHAGFHPQQRGDLRARPGEYAEISPHGHPVLTSPTSGRTQPSFFCDKCSYGWPCPTYLWATQSEPFRLIIQPKTIAAEAT